MGKTALLASLLEVIDETCVVIGDEVAVDILSDETLHPRDEHPVAMVRPRTTAEVAQLARWADERAVPLTLRGAGTGLSGGASALKGAVLVCFDQLTQIEIDPINQVARCGSGVTLSALDDALQGTGLHHPVYPGERGGTLGGNVSTNAGGMRAVRHGVTRHHVLSLTAVLIDGSIITTGGPVLKSSSGYDLTQLLIGSEGTLAMVTEVTVKLTARLEHAATVLLPFRSLSDIAGVVPSLLGAGLAPSILEYLDALALSSIANAADLEIGIDEAIMAEATFFLLVVLEARTEAQLDDDLAHAAQLVAKAGALEVFVLPGVVAASLIVAREHVFWVAKSAGADDIIDTVVPRAEVPAFLDAVNALAARHGAYVAGCGHIGDGNVHLSVFCGDPTERAALLMGIFTDALARGGAISGEHGLGSDKLDAYLALADPTIVSLQRAIKAVFDPKGLLNPHLSLDESTRS